MKFLSENVKRVPESACISFAPDELSTIRLRPARAGLGQTSQLLRPYGRGLAVGRGLGVGVHLPVHGVDVAVGVAVAVAVGVAVGVRVAVGVEVAVGVMIGVCVAVGVAVAVAVGVGEPPPAQKISIEAVGALGAYPPTSQILVVPSVSVGKLRRAVTNAGTGVLAAQVLVPGL